MIYGNSGECMKNSEDLCRIYKDFQGCLRIYKEIRGFIRIYFCQKDVSAQNLGQWFVPR